MDELLNPSFGRAFRGYDTHQVDRLLGAAAARLADCERRNAQLEECLARVEQELETFREQEQAFREVLVVAQRAADEVRARAEAEAEEMVEDAELETRRIVLEANAKREQAESEARRLAAIEHEMESGYRAFLVAAHELLEGRASASKQRPPGPPLREVASG